MRSRPGNLRRSGMLNPRTVESRRAGVRPAAAEQPAQQWSEAMEDPEPPEQARTARARQFALAQQIGDVARTELEHRAAIERCEQPEQDAAPAARPEQERGLEVDQ